MQKMGKKGMAKKVVAVCLSAAMCCTAGVPAMTMPMVYAAEANDSSAADEAFVQGALWQFYPVGEDVWYVRNSGNGKFLGRDENNKIALLEEPFSITLEKKSDGTIALDFGGTKRYLSVGSSYNYSLGEQAYKYTQFFEKVQNGTQVTYQKTTEVTAGKEYLLAMAQKKASGTTAQESKQYALTNVFNGSTSDPRIQPLIINLTENGTDADGTISDEHVLTAPYVSFRAPEYGKTLPDAEVLVSGCGENEIKTETIWSPEAETAGAGTAYQANVKMTAQGNYSFKENQIPKYVSVNGQLTALADGEATLSENGKTMMIRHTFDAITDIRQNPEYTVPTGLEVKKGQKLSDVALPEGFAFEEDMETVLDTLGAQKFHVTYTPADTEHYKTVEHIEVQIDVKEERQAFEQDQTLWMFEKGEEDGKWKLKNTAAGTYLAKEGEEASAYISLNSTGTEFAVEQNEDGTLVLDFGGTKQHLQVGSGNRFSLGEKTYRTQLAVKERTENGFIFTKTSVIEEGKEYAVLMAYRSDDAGTATASRLYAMCGNVYGSEADSRLLSHEVYVAGDKLGVISGKEDAVKLGKVKAALRIPEMGKALENAQVSVLYGEAGTDYQVQTVWNPADETAKADQNYEVNVTLTALGERKFTEESLPDSVLLNDGTEASLGTQAVVLSEDGKTLEITYNFQALTDDRKVPEYTVPQDLTVPGGSRLSDVTLPAGFAFEEPEDTVLTNAGTFTYHLTYTPEDTEHYKTVTGIEVKIKVVQNIKVLADAGAFWKLEKGGQEGQWALLNVRTGKYLGHDEDTSTPHIALNSEPEYCEITQNEDGTWHLNYGGLKPNLQVGSGNKFSMGEKVYRTVLFVKKRVGDTVVLEKASELKEGQEYVAAMTHRDHDASAATASELYVLTDQVDPNGGDARILSQKISVADGKIDVLADADYMNHLSTPQITVTEPIAGEKQEDVTVEIPYAVEGEYTAKTEWNPQGDFEAGKEYQAAVTITAAGDHYFTEKEKPSCVFSNGNKIMLDEENVTLVNEKTIKAVIRFAEVTAAGNVVMDAAEHGTVSVDRMTAPSGTKVRIMVKPDENYELKGLKVLRNEQELPLTRVSDTTWEFTMEEGEVHVQAEFAEIQYAIKTAESQHGTVTAVTEAGKDREVLIRVQPEKGYELNQLTVAKTRGSKKIAYEKTEEGYTFIMPGEEVKIRASFKKTDYRISSETRGNGVAVVQETAQYEENVLIYVTTPENCTITVHDMTTGKDIEVCKADDSLYLFSMPDGNVKVSTVFTAKPGKPQESEKPQETEKPQESEKPRETEKSQETEKPQQPQKPQQTTKPKAVTNVKAKVTKKGIRIKWKKVSGADGYDIYRSARKKSGYKKIHAVTKGKTQSYLDQKARKGKTYYYKIKTYKKVNGRKMTSNWSEAVGKKR